MHLGADNVAANGKRLKFEILKEKNSTKHSELSCLLYLLTVKSPMRCHMNVLASVCSHCCDGILWSLWHS